MAGMAGAGQEKVCPALAAALRTSVEKTRFERSARVAPPPSTGNCSGAIPDHRFRPPVVKSPQ
jgi:hypothetical protein